MAGRYTVTKRLTIGFDVDGVLAAFSPAFVNLANSLFDLNLRPEDQTGWTYQYKGHNLTDEQVNEIWDVINDTPNWWESLAKLPNTTAVSDAAARHKVFFITHRNPTLVGHTIEDQTANWIRKNFFIHNPLVITCEKKGLTSAGLELDAFIDDKLSNCQDVAIETIIRDTGCRVFLQEAPYNNDQTMLAFRRIAAADPKYWFNQLRYAKNANDFIATVEGDFDGSGSIAIAA